jgi:hypothetical protein
MIYRITFEGEGKKRKLALPVKDRQELLALRDSKKNLNLLTKARNGDNDAKSKLLQLAYNLGHVDGQIAGCKSIGSFFFHDVDYYEDSIKEKILSKKDEIGLVMLERSVSGGWHLVCKRELGKTILENQVRVATILKLEMDTNTKDLQRVCYSTSGSEDDLVYLDDAIFEEPLSPEECEKEYQLLKEREKKNLEEVPKEAKKANKHYRPWEDDTKGSGTSVPSATAQKCQTPCVDEPTERTRFIFRECMKEEDVTDTDLVNEGGRHNSVKVVLSHCNQLLTQAETLGMLKELMPANWNDDNIRQLVTAYYTDYYNENQRLSVFQKRVFKESKRIGHTQGPVADVIMTQQAGQSPSAPPEMPKRLPKLIELLASKTPKIYQPAVVNAVFPPLATHLCEVRFCYTDNVEHEATLMNCLLAPTGAGKGCIDEPISRIMADIKRRDEENERREAEWKKDCQKKGANKDKLVRPEGLVIQQIDPDMTKPALVTRMDEAEGHFVYVKLNELDLFEQLKGQTGKQHFQLMCLAFDPGAEYGQTRVGTQSVTARPQCRFNWNACSTINKGRRFFSRVLTDGPISRINFCTIPEVEIGAEQPIYGKYDMAFDEALKIYIDNLVSAHGLIDCPQAYKLAKKLQEECAEFARLSQSDVYWNLSHRACVIAWLKACVLYVANGQKWEKSIEDFIRWSLNYDLWCKMAFFGADIEAADREGERTGTRGPQNLLALLPDEFTIEDARRMRVQQGKCAEKTGNMVSTWKKRHYVVQMSDGSFQKSPQFKNRNQ